MTLYSIAIRSLGNSMEQHNLDAAQLLDTVAQCSRQMIPIEIRIVRSDTVYRGSPDDWAGEGLA